MAKYYLTYKAIEDLSEIWNYTYETWSELQADKYYYQLLEFCQEVADNPNVGRKYSQITKGLRGFKANKHIIFYRLSGENEIEVLRILHEKMDLKNRIKK